MEHLGIPLGAHHVMLDNILTRVGKSRAGIKPSFITNATDTSI